MQLQCANFIESNSLPFYVVSAGQSSTYCRIGYSLDGEAAVEKTMHAGLAVVDSGLV
jgi:hypothetical protein